MDTIKQNNILNTKNNVVLPWIKYLENIRGYGVHTLDAYKRDVVEFLKFCTERNHDFLSPDKYILREFLSVPKETWYLATFSFKPLIFFCTGE